ncbi:flavin reductase family protein [Actinomadura rupiterrae]|uniref:flavin reductase family protein n=1 Tax=Actinomadura rupiterrae TaxID=559627 RepID=UPI0020A2C2FA|nr:flavin reductase family protein [Actinomadura rupiterrae]MCP2335842.1 flavin reductase (DIM6/NTAB) family NADH-FMN oxidoreductase RutF [Actinomadura rupiterrae]
MEHIGIEPAILYFGTPVVLLGTAGRDGHPNLGPMSSAFWLGWRCVLGMSTSSKTAQNMLATGECTINLPSTAQAGAVDRLARTTGSDPVSPSKLERGYRHVRDKFGVAGLTPVASETVRPPRVAECPVAMEAVVEDSRPLAAELGGNITIFETRVQRVHVHPSITMDGHENRIDPDRWRPLIMSFQKFYGLGDQVHPSRLAEIPEHLYRTPDIARAAGAPRTAAANAN